MLAVADDLTIGVLVGKCLLRLLELWAPLPRAGHLADDRYRAAEFNSSQLRVCDACVHDDGDARIALEVHPALAARQRCEPKRTTGPNEPQRSCMRTLGSDGGRATHPLHTEERIDLLASHRD